MSRTKLSCAVAALAIVAAACGGGATDASTTTSAGTAAPDVTAGPAVTTTVAAPDVVSTTTPDAPTTSEAPSTTGAPAAVTAELSAFRNAVAETTEVTSAQMAASIIITGAEGMPSDTPVALSFEGAFDNTTGDFAFSMDLGDFMDATGAGGEEIPPEFADLFSTIELRQLGETAYVKLGFFNALLGVETDWLSMPADEADSVGDFTGGFVPTEPTTFFDAFRDIDATGEDLGSDTVRGTTTTHYRVTIDVAALVERGDTATLEALEFQGPIPLDELVVDFWVGGADDLLYKFEMAIDGADVVTEQGEGFDSMMITFEIWGYNEPISVTAPDPADVTNIDDIDLSGWFGDL